MAKKNARSIKLDNAIEAELKIMLTLGLDKAPISATTLHERLLAKRIIKGAISTLTPRSDMIDEYSFQQRAAHDIAKDEPKYGTVEYYKARNQKLIADNSELNRQLSANTAALDAIIKNVESKSAVKVEDLVRQILNPMEDIPY
ncbi:MAG: hypothetical protein JKY93_02015 [Gammaproteobacteria bacterium]|nr:hypothetical protein [Gammaproteobacteria bacterium]